MKEDEQYCAVCKAELKMGPQLKFAALHDDDEADQVLCPICKRNFMENTEEMCAECRERANEKATIEPERDIDPDNDEEWRNYLDEDEKEAISNKGDEEEMLSLSQLEEEEARELFDDEEELDDDYYDNDLKDEDDFDFPAGDVNDYDEEDGEDEEEDLDDDF
jgi:hypothetical protein